MTKKFFFSEKCFQSGQEFLQWKVTQIFLDCQWLKMVIKFCTKKLPNFFSPKTECRIFNNKKWPGSFFWNKRATKEILMFSQKRQTKKKPHGVLKRRVFFVFVKKMQNSINCEPSEKVKSRNKIKFFQTKKAILFWACFFVFKLKL